MTQSSNSVLGRWSSHPMRSALAAARRFRFTAPGVRHMRSSTWAWWKPALALSLAAAAPRNVRAQSTAEAFSPLPAMHSRVAISTEISTPSSATSRRSRWPRSRPPPRMPACLAICSASDRITANRDRLVHDAKQAAITLAGSGYCRAHRSRYPGRRRKRAGNAEAGRLPDAAGRLRQRPRREGSRTRRPHPVRRRVPAGTLVSEQYFLDLEREAFLSLCGERKTQERIAYTLSTGKPLRN